ncbi:MAG: DUF3987 domain-containing protein [Clostridia bacterium]|nr:DUF3987 domain-containing protein [Clostridia bacterium]MBR6861790.1 DUF3987 domain-containing protein [Acidaminococcaceae bacterium]
MATNILTNNAKNANNSGYPPHTVMQYDPFQPFIPLKPSADMLPSFPVECLPPKLRDYVEAVATHTQTPVDMAAGITLGVLAACLQGKVQVEGNIGHYEQTSLYIFLIAPPGSRKSAIIREMTAPIEDYEQQYNEKMKPTIRKTRQKRESLQRDINRLTKQLETKYDKMTELELQHAQDNLADVPDLRPMQIFTDDCTSESMIRLLRENGGRMALISAEGGAFDNIVGRYSKKPNLDVWLKGICGDTIRVDRINREPDYIRHPALSMIISAQPSVLGEIMRDGMLDGRGFLARLLYINVSGTGIPKAFQSEPIPEGIKEAYRSLITGLLNRPANQPVTLHLSPEAVKRMEKFCRDLETVLQKDHRDMREWGSKFIGLILRIAGLLHASCSEAEHIDQRMIENAIQIGVYAFAQAQYAYSVLGADETVEKAMHVVSRLRRGRISRISRSDLYQRCRGRYFRDVRELDPVLDLLECHGYIRIEATPYSGTGRPPTSLIYFNPLALEDE